MLFKPEHIDPIIEGRKTQTRRIAKPGETLHRDYATGRYGYTTAVLTASGRPKWVVGSDYAVQPGRGRPIVWWCNTPEGFWWETNLPDIGEFDNWSVRADWRPLRIRLLDIRHDWLKDITDDEARAEGVASVADYAALWDAINTRAGQRWADNPLVWALTFEVAR